LSNLQRFFRIIYQPKYYGISLAVAESGELGELLSFRSSPLFAVFTPKPPYGVFFGLQVLQLENYYIPLMVTVENFSFQSSPSSPISLRSSPKSPIGELGELGERKKHHPPL